MSPINWQDPTFASSDWVGYAIPANPNDGLVVVGRQGGRGQLAERRPIDYGKASWFREATAPCNLCNTRCTKERSATFRRRSRQRSGANPRNSARCVSESPLQNLSTPSYDFSH